MQRIKYVNCLVKGNIYTTVPPTQTLFHPQRPPTGPIDFRPRIANENTCAGDRFGSGPDVSTSEEPSLKYS
jgi:hypothetical protein